LNHRDGRENSYIHVAGGADQTDSVTNEDGRIAITLAIAFVRVVVPTPF